MDSWKAVYNQDKNIDSLWKCHNEAYVLMVNTYV